MYDELKQGLPHQRVTAQHPSHSGNTRINDPAAEFLNLDDDNPNQQGSLYEDLLEDCGYSTGGQGQVYNDWDDNDRASEAEEDDQKDLPSTTQPFTATKQSGGSGLTSESISTYDSNKAALKLAGQKKLKYFPLHDEGKVYKYEDDPKLYMRIRKKIQNRESARRVRMKDKDETVHVQSKLSGLLEENQRLQIENSALKSENAMLRNQVEFMEKLLLKDNNSSSQPGSTSLRRTETSGNGKYFTQVGMLGLLMVVSYLPESSTPSGTGTTFNQRVLTEITTGFHIFSAKSVPAFFLSLLRSTALLCILFLVISAAVTASKKRKNRHSDAQLIDDFSQKKDS